MIGRFGLLLVLAGVVTFAAGCRAPGTASRVATKSETPGKSETPAAAVDQGDPVHPKVRIETTLGDIVLELDGEKAPGTVLNFLQYVRSRFYDGTIFHRVLKDSMIHGGGFTPDMNERIRGLRASVGRAWHSPLKNERGTIAMLSGKGPGGAGTAQFYINVTDNLELSDPRYHGAYAVFGKVISGMDTVERIRYTPVTTHPDYAAGRSAVVPVEPVVIKSIRLASRFDPIQVQAVAAGARAAQERRADAIIAELEKKTGRKAVTTSSGMRYVDLDIGAGPQPLVTDSIEFHYRGTFLDGTEFESTLMSEPTVREVAALIEGLRDGVITMNEGGRRTLVIPPELAYGEGGIPGKIPPDSTLVFEVELLAIR